jgi:hypothetical protein
MKIRAKRRAKLIKSGLVNKPEPNWKVWRSTYEPLSIKECQDLLRSKIESMLVLVDVMKRKQKPIILRTIRRTSPSRKSHPKRKAGLKRGQTDRRMGKRRKFKEVRSPSGRLVASSSGRRRSHGYGSRYRWNRRMPMRRRR